MKNKFDIPLSFTFEISEYGYSAKPVKCNGVKRPNIIAYNTEDYIELGRKLVEAISLFNRVKTVLGKLERTQVEGEVSQADNLKERNKFMSKGKTSEMAQDLLKEYNKIFNPSESQSFTSPEYSITLPKADREQPIKVSFAKKSEVIRPPILTQSTSSSYSRQSRCDSIMGNSRPVLHRLYNGQRKNPCNYKLKKSCQSGASVVLKGGKAPAKLCKEVSLKKYRMSANKHLVDVMEGFGKMIGKEERRVESGLAVLSQRVALHMKTGVITRTKTKPQLRTKSNTSFK
eukprot:TRINITY_DN12911_c0_g1_i1.p1 TRINITY_DN12911_c0_g1~~TRINITY_DN12911_c0_g1_i1.p1  ORF type:complete len:287 (-),score=56.61 TRINITY_DN12911_c0_g1_i1:149-1009(-)